MTDILTVFVYLFLIFSFFKHELQFVIIKWQAKQLRLLLNCIINFRFLEFAKFLIINVQSFICVYVWLFILSLYWRSFWLILHMLFLFVFLYPNRERENKKKYSKVVMLLLSVYNGYSMIPFNNGIPMIPLHRKVCSGCSEYNAKCNQNSYKLRLICWY